MPREQSPEEPLHESAPLAHRLAREHCRADPATGGDCAWYHGFWQYMRLMGIANAGHVNFIAGQLRVLARAGHFPRLLIAGSADYSMHAYASWTYHQEGAELAATIVDRCEAPLALTRWYGARYGAPVEAYLADVLGFDGPTQYDVIVANCFLGYFDPPGRTRLFQRFAKLLRPGGRLIITNRIRPGEGHAPIGFTRDQGRAFMEVVRAAAQRLPPALPVDPHDMARMAQAYADRFVSVPLRSAAEVAELLEAGGFSIDRLDTADNAGRATGPAVTGPTLAETAGYVGVVAIRR